jgi:hypothetical protein
VGPTEKRFLTISKAYKDDRLIFSFVDGKGKVEEKRRELLGKYFGFLKFGPVIPFGQGETTTEDLAERLTVAEKTLSSDPVEPAEKHTNVDPTVQPTRGDTDNSGQIETGNELTPADPVHEDNDNDEQVGTQGLAPTDAEARHILDGSPIRLYNARGSFAARAHVTERMKAGAVWVRDGWPDLNQLTAGAAVLPDHAVDIFAFSAGQSSFDAKVEVARA